MYCLSTYVSEKCLLMSLFYFTLQSRLNLDTRYLSCCSSVQFSKIAKKLNIDLCQFFSHWKEALFLLKSWNIKWGSPYSFCSIAVKSAHQMHFLRFFSEDWGQFQHFESHLGKKQPQAKILIASLFRQLHFNNVTGVLCEFLASARFQLIV